nr:LptF/LptG family permease [Desulfobulbaceae bacterium]
MPLVLYSYIASEILAPFFGSLIVLNGILFTGRLMQVIDLIFSFNIGFADFIRLCAYLLPNLLPFSIPMASTMAVIIAFSRMNNDNEILALKAAGISLYRLLAPIVVFGLCASLLTFFVSTRLIPAGSVSMKGLFLKLVTKKIEKGIIQEKRFSENTGSLVLYADSVDKDTKKWSGVYISDLRDTNNPITVLAKEGSLSSRLDQMVMTLDLADGSMYRSIDESTQIIAFKHYTTNLPLEPPKAIGDMSSSVVTKNDLNQTELLQHADQYGRKTPRGISFLVEYHLRLVLSVGCFILSLLGLPIAFKSRAGSRNIGIPLGLGFFILYYVTVTAAKGMCDSSSIPVAILMWTPNAVFGTLTLAILYITASEKWHTMMNPVIAISHRLIGRKKEATP